MTPDIIFAICGVGVLLAWAIFQTALANGGRITNKSTAILSGYVLPLGGLALIFTALGITITGWTP